MSNWGAVVAATELILWSEKLAVRVEAAGIYYNKRCVVSSSKTLIPLYSREHFIIRHGFLTLIAYATFLQKA